ncbi:hypothetical protein MBCUT_02050 [Methanobrevibacter cuticularis]|uniref:Uncharacterized protein n=1 Tax=Methanobrevibacter cuticularis TaxID=47311 RepID=A0A166FCD5_9EURY|nr:hypothetical protein [Methanobrevibacter cuticularis]KZX17530.1 hypothetical protein MBCUT_02050 [Methanobrevibacter cuticularis]
MLISREEFYEGLDNNKYLGIYDFEYELMDLDRYVGELDYNEFLNEKFLKQSTYEFIKIPSDEYMFYWDSLGCFENIESIEEYKKQYKEYKKYEYNRDKYQKYCEKNNMEFRIEEYVEYLKNIDYEMKDEIDSEYTQTIMLISKNDSDLISVIHAKLENCDFKDESAIYYFLNFAKIIFELKYDECVDFACIVYKLIYNESPFSSKDLSSSQQEVFYKARDFLNIIEDFDQNKYKLLFEFLAKNIKPKSFKKKSVMFTENQITKINSIEDKGFSENLRFVVDNYFQDIEKRKQKNSYFNDSQMNKIISSIVVAFAMKIGLYGNIDEKNDNSISEIKKEKFLDLMEEFRKNILYILRDAEVIYNKFSHEEQSPEEKAKMSLGVLKKIVKSEVKTNYEISKWNESIEQLDEIFELGLIDNATN